MQMEKVSVWQRAGNSDSFEELYDLIQAGIDDFENGRVLSEAEVVANMKSALL